ncbi:MAG: hypothetical protein JWQ38_216 [Flavipsychrobacter sp.]|nr:hypothetical protein [Flavipsychrobacter sp.]
MKRVLLFAVAMFAISPAMMAKKNPPAAATAESANEIHWITSFEELQQKMAKSPKKVYVDVYTDWCGWCKKMDATTFSNPKVAKYMNLNYYCVRFNAERQDVINFQGKQYAFRPDARANSLAVEWMMPGGKGQMSYPTAIILLENFQNPQPIPGYMTPNQLEPLVTFFGDNTYKHQAWDAYQKNYKPTWENGAPVNTAPPAGH